MFTSVIQWSRETFRSRARSKGETRGLESRWGGATVALGSPLLGRPGQGLGGERSSRVLSVVDRQAAEDRKERRGRSPASYPGQGAANPYKQEELAQRARLPTTFHLS